MGKKWKTVTEFIFLGPQITADGDCSHEIKRCLLLGRKVMTNLDSILESRDITDKGPSNQSYHFSSSCVWMWQLDHKEGWAPKNWCFWTEVLEKTLESPLDCKEIQPVHSKGDQPWVLFGMNDGKAETPILWPPDKKNWLTGKDPDAEKDWRQEEKETTEDEMVGWHHRLDGREFEWTPGVGDGQGGLAWRAAIHGVAKSRTWLSDWTEMNWTVTCQAPLSMEFSRQEYWSGLPFPPPGNLPNPRIEPCLESLFELQTKWFLV